MTQVLFQNSYKQDDFLDSKESCVLLHGLFGMSSNLLGVARAVSEIYNPFLFDLPNHGQSPTINPSNFFDMIKILRNTIEEKIGSSSIHILGHSLGGKVAMIYALMYPEFVKSIVIMDIAPVTYPPIHLDVIKGFKEIEKIKPNIRKEAIQILEQYTDSLDIASFLAKNIIFEENKYAGSQIRLDELIEYYDDLRSFPTEKMQGKKYIGPTLVLRAETTEYFEDSYMQKIDEFFPKWELETIFDSGHNIHIDNPTETQELILDFYKQ